MKKKIRNHPNIAVLPPFIIGIPFGLGTLLQFIFPILLPSSPWIGITLGIFCAIPSAILLLMSHVEFRNAKTSMLPRSKSRVLIVNGPFKFTRNPIYAGLSLLYAGISLGTSSFWLLIFLPIIIIALHYFVILPEEHYLESRFSEEYRAYKNRVRRWV